MKTTNPIGKFYVLKTVIKLKLFLLCHSLFLEIFEFLSSIQGIEFANGICSFHYIFYIVFYPRKLFYALSLQTGEFVAEVMHGCSGYGGSLRVDGSGVWIDFPESTPQGWDFGITGSPPVQLTNTPLLHPNHISKFTKMPIMLKSACLAPIDTKSKESTCPISIVTFRSARSLRFHTILLEGA